VAQHDVVLISDYDKGVCTPSLLRVVIDAGRAAGVPVLVDPIRGTDYSRYQGATTMTPNRTEAGLATGIKIAANDDAFRAGQQLSAASWSSNWPSSRSIATAWRSCMPTAAARFFQRVPRARL